DDPAAGPTVLHFPVALTAPGVRILDTWHTMGMRGTGSHDIRLGGGFGPGGAIHGRRPQGEWDPVFHRVTRPALPIIYAVYLGVAEAARDLAVREAARKRDDAAVQSLVGEMDTELTAARLAHASMVHIAATARPGPETTNAVAMARSLTGRAGIRTVGKAMEGVEGGAFYRSLGLERL